MTTGTSDKWTLGQVNPDNWNLGQVDPGTSEPTDNWADTVLVAMTDTARYSLSLQYP